MEMHLEVKVVGKGPKGRTACGSSAYRSCDKIIDNTGHVHDYHRKGGYVTGGIELPAGASEDLLNRGTLWRRHEARDIRKDAELFREVTVALPNELDYAASVSVIRQLTKPLTDRGMCVQWDIHDTTKKEQRNLHAHLMVTMRELQPDGTFGNKNRSWNKYNSGLNLADVLRPEAARLMNEELARIGSAEKVEHESYVERGIDKLSQKHLGPAATAIERRGERSYKGDQNRYIDFLNRIHAENLRQAEAHTQSGRLEDLIAGAQKQGSSNETFKDWDALFAMLRDNRRAQAAIRTELKKLEKVSSAYEEGNESYLAWAGCDPKNETQRQTVRTMQKDLQIQLKQLDLMENFILDSKDLYKAHNKVIYTSRKIEWEEYWLSRKKRGMLASAIRIHSLAGYVDSLRSRLRLIDFLFRTPQYQIYKEADEELQQRKAELKQAWAEYRELRREHKEHKKERRESEKNAKRTLADIKRLSKDNDRDER